MSRGIIPVLLLLGAAFVFTGATRSKKLLRPVTGRLSSRWGNRKASDGTITFHNGVDIAVPVGTRVRAPMAGIVQQIYKGDKGGVQMRVIHDNGFVSGYAHLYKTVAQRGQRVRRGQTLALSGKSGNVTGPHLHFTLRDDSGKLVNPEKHFKFS